MKGRAALKALAVLAFVELAAFAVFSSRIGFYHDDWVVLENLSQAGGYWAGVRSLSWLATRPLDMLFLPLLYALGGLHPLPYHLARLALDTAAGWLFYLLVAELTERPAAALVAAALAILIPNRDVIHFWLGISIESAAIVLVFASLLAHLRWLKGRGAAWLAASLFLYVASLLLYEALAFFPALIAAAMLARGKTLKQAVAACWPYIPALAAALLWQRVGSALLVATPDTKTMGLSVHHALKVFGAGFECVANRVLHICFLSNEALALREPWTLPACALLALPAAWLVWRGKDKERGVGGLAALAAAAFVAAYLPYAATADYSPQIFGIMSRTNAGGAWAGGLLFALLAESLAAKPGARRAFLGLLVFCFMATDWYRAEQWGRAWQAQREVLDALSKQSASLPQGSTVLLTGVPAELDHALVFDASWDFDSALRVTTGRRDLKGDLLRRKGAPTQGPNLFVFDGEHGKISLDASRP